MFQDHLLASFGCSVILTNNFLTSKQNETKSGDIMKLPGENHLLVLDKNKSVIWYISYSKMGKNNLYLVSSSMVEEFKTNVTLIFSHRSESSRH